jgi:hypothetical protein
MLNLYLQPSSQISIGSALYRLQKHSTTQMGHPNIIGLVAQDRALNSVMKSFKIPAWQQVYRMEAKDSN